MRNTCDWACGAFDTVLGAGKSVATAVSSISVQSLQGGVRRVTAPGCSPGCAELTREGWTAGKEGSVAIVVDGICPERVRA